MGNIVSVRDVVLEGMEKTLYEIILDQSSDPIFCFDPSGKYLYINRAFSSAFNLMPSDIIGKLIWDVFPGAEGDKRFAAVKKAIETKNEVVLDVKVDAIDGTRYYMTTVTPIMDAMSIPKAAICISKDITQRKRTELALEHANAEATQKNHELDQAVKALYRKSITDGLTTLYNRQYTFDILEQATNKYTDIPFDLVLMILDLDLFKNINDQYGHMVGDQALVQFSKHLKMAFETIGTVGRYGGEEFIVVFENIPYEDIKQRVAQFRLFIQSQPYAQIDYPLTFSAGLCRYSGEGLDQLIKKADDLMYQGKNQGRDRLVCD